MSSVAGAWLVRLTRDAYAAAEADAVNDGDVRLGQLRNGPVQLVLGGEEAEDSIRGEPESGLSGTWAGSRARVRAARELCRGLGAGAGAAGTGRSPQRLINLARQPCLHDRLDVAARAEGLAACSAQQHASDGRVTGGSHVNVLH